MNVRETPDNDGNTAPLPAVNIPVNTTDESLNQNEDPYDELPDPAALATKQPEIPPLEKAKAAMCPIKKYNDKTLWEMVTIDRKALVYVAESGSKYSEEIAGYETLICEYAQQQASA